MPGLETEHEHDGAALGQVFAAIAQNIRIAPKLGKGAFGAVVLGTHKETRFNVAIKRIPCSKTGKLVLEKEIDVLKSCFDFDALAALNREFHHSLLQGH